MSLDIRYLTNGEKKLYVVRHTDTGERELYNTREEVPQCIRHYAPEGEPKFVEPDLARIFGVQDVFYPNFPMCAHEDYVGKKCIAEACKYAVPTYKDCPYFQKALAERNEVEKI